MPRVALRRGVAVATVALTAPLVFGATSAAPALASDSVASSVGFGSPLHGAGDKSIQKYGGYAARGTTFTTATASWKVAKVTCRTAYESYSALVGIGGDGTRIVERTGVATGCQSGQPRYTAWYEVYPAVPVYYQDPISTGDVFTATVSAAVSADGPSFTLTITDETKDWTESVTKSAPFASNATAEALIEATPGQGYPTITSVKFSDVTFNGQSLDSFSNLVKYDARAGSPAIYRPTKIRHHTDFKMKPIN